MSSKISISIGDVKYSVTGDESQEYMQHLGQQIEKKMRSFTSKNPYLSTTVAAIMSSLEFCDEATKSKIEIERLNENIKRLQRDLDEAGRKLTFLKAKSERGQ